MPRRRHTRLSRPDVEVESPLIDCRLLDLSTAGLGIETSVGLRLGVPYPFRLRDGGQTLATEAVVRWCRLVRNESVDGESRPVYRAGVSFVEWLQPADETADETADEPPDETADEPADEPEPPASRLETQIDVTLDQWMNQSRLPGNRPGSERKIIHKASRQRER